MYYIIFTFQFAYNWFSGGASSFAKTPFDLAVYAVITINTDVVVCFARSVALPSAICRTVGKKEIPRGNCFLITFLSAGVVYSAVFFLQILYKCVYLRE